MSKAEKRNEVTIYSSPSLAKLTVDTDAGIVKLDFTERSHVQSNLEHDEMRANLNHIIDEYVNTGGCDCMNHAGGASRTLYFAEGQLTDGKLLDLVETLKENGHMGKMDFDKCLRNFLLEYEAYFVRDMPRGNAR